jgi:PAS domain S-box-containing protein
MALSNCCDELTYAFPGGGEMARRMCEFNWSETPLGLPQAWPLNLKTSLRITLTSRHPMSVWWGERLTHFYNDSYAALLGAKHPAALAQPAATVWPEIWHELGPLAESAMRSGEGTYDEARPFVILRNGVPAETYVAFSYSPIPDERGGFGGILCAGTDETQRVTSERQLALLRELVARTAGARTWREVCVRAASALETNPHDLAFALIYEIDRKSRVATLAAQAGIAGANIAALDLPGIWRLEETLRTQSASVITVPKEISGALPSFGGYPVRDAIILPVTAHGTGVNTVLVAGLSPLRLLDRSYRRFMELVASGVAAAIATAQLEATNAALRESEQSNAAELEALRRLQDVSTQLIGVGNGKALYEQILDAAIAVLHADFASIQMFHPERGPEGELHLLGHRGFPPFAAATWEWVRPSSATSCAEAIRTRRRAVIPVIERSEPLQGTDALETYRKAGIRAVQTTPLLSRYGALLGVFSTHWRESHDLSASEHRNLDLLARQVADLIARSLTEDELKKSERRYHQAVEAAPNGMLAVNPEGEIVVANSYAARQFGYDKEELYGKRVEMLLPERFRALYWEHHEELQGAPGAHVLDAGHELYGLRKDGTEFPVEIGLNPTGTGHEAPALYSIVDITGQKRLVAQRAELRAKERALVSERALRKTEAKLASVVQALSAAELAASIAHEVNQPLSGVVMNAEAGMRWLGGDPPNIQEARESLALIARDGSRASAVIRRIRDSLKKGTRIADSVDLNELVQETVILARANLEKQQVTVHSEFASGNPRVSGDRVQLQQVILNLLVNAAEAMASVAGARELRTDVSRNGKGAIAVAVRDSGTGVRPQDAPRLFEAFFTTKPDGMGMGLSISRSIIEAHRGRIWAEVNDGPGLTVRFELPAEGASEAVAGGL